LNKQNGFETITYGSVRKLLKKTNLSLGWNGCGVYR
jgi:hypothetical protein